MLRPKSISYKGYLLITIAAFVLLGLVVSPPEPAFATIPPQGACDVTLTSGQNIQAVVDLGGPKTICLQGTFKQSVIIGPEDTASGYITIQGVSPGGIMDGQNGVGTPDLGTSYSSGMDAFELLPGVSNVTIRDLEIKDYKDPLEGTGTGNAIQAWGPYAPGPATSNVNVWSNNMHGFSWNGILVGNSGTGLHSNWSVEGNTIVPCWIGIELTNTNDSIVEDNTVSGGGCFTPPDDWVIGIMLQARNIAAEGGSGSLTMSNVSVQDNTIVALGPATLEYGIYLFSWANGGPTATLSNIKVGGSGNQLENNTKYGIVLYGAEQGTVDGVNIMDNDILNNDTGIRLAGTSTNVTANLNNISGNTTWGARNTAAAELNAELNWWGSSTGPTHSGNPGGTGDAVNDNVDYHPWLVVWPLTFYWKDYNGEDPGGYMPDIDQNQDFDKVIVRTEETGAGVSFSGTWSVYNNQQNASGGTLKYSNDLQTPASCTFTFNGTSISWIGFKQYNMGISEVWIDGQLDTTVDLYTVGSLWKQVLYTNNNLSHGQHTITIKPTNQKNPLSTGLYTGVDAFDVDNKEQEYCAPVAEANSLWWLDKKDPTLEIFIDPSSGTGYAGGDINQDGNSDVLDLVQELAIMMNTNVGHTGTTVEDEQTGIDAFLAKYQLGNKLYEHTVYDPEFSYIEEEVERSQDVKLDLGFWNILACDGGPGNGFITWQRVGGHAVSVAGVDSQNSLFAISDPDNDAAESGGLGVIRPVPNGHPLHPNDTSIHNIEANASHDIYTVVPSASPGGIWALKNYPGKVNFPIQEWGQPTPMPWPPYFYPCEESMIITEIEAAVIVSPIICGNSVIDPGETCDPPGGQLPPNGNPCRQTCTYCGDSIVNNGEQCDDGNGTNNDGCTNNCTLPVCGDSIVQPQLGEQCDDGNNNNGDGCSSTCKWEPDISANPPIWNFGDVTVGNSSTKTFAVSNVGLGDLHITAITVTGANFSKQNDLCSSKTIASGGSCTVDVKFSPMSLGYKSATLSIPSNDPDENPLNVPLSGTGDVGPAQCLLSPDSDSVPRGGTLGFQITLMNTTNQIQSFKFATKATLPNGSKTRYLIKPTPFTLNPYQTRHFHRSQFIPNNAPLGTYTYNGYIGLPGMINYECWFVFEVTQ